MSSQDKEFEEQIAEAGKKLLDPPSSVEDLLPLLNKAENYLSRVEQSPSKSIEKALSPCMKALIADKLFKHSDIDVKVAVASCISEITRISAPEAPYNDDQMKEAFQLIVSSFEHLYDMSSLSYEKRTSILATVAKVRSCVVMLDLECDELIIQMFQHFLKAIRNDHPQHVFSSMETIMTLVIEESEDISPELLSPILATLKRNNEGILPIAKKLAEKVLENCESKLNAALGQALKSSGTTVGDYSEVVGLICRDNNAEINRTEVNAAEEQEVENEATSPKSEVSSGVKQTADDEPSTDSISAKKEDDADQKTEMEITGLSSNDKPSEPDSGNEDKTARKPRKNIKKRGRKQSTVKKSTKPSDSTHIDGEKEAEQPLDNDKDAKSDHPSSPRDNQSAEADLPSDADKEVDVAPPPKEEENKSVDVSSPSRSAEKTKVEESPKDAVGQSDSDRKEQAEVGKDSEDETSDEDKTPATGKTSAGDSEATNDAENNSSKQPTKKAHGSTPKDKALTKSAKLKKGPMKGKIGRPKTNASKKDTEKEAVSSSKSGKKRQRDEEEPDETPPKNKVKGKQTPVKETGSGGKDYGQEMVGAKVKVWWPDDKKFYKGEITYFNPKTKSHKVVYDDGDVEKLKLHKEIWERVEDDSSSSEDQPEDEETRESSPDVPTKRSIGRPPKNKTPKTGGKLKKLKSGGSASKGKPSSLKPKAKQSDDMDVDSDEESEKSHKSAKGKGSTAEPSRTPGSGKQAGGGGSKAQGNRTSGSGTKTGGSKSAGTGSKTGSKTGKKRQRGA